MTKQNSINWSNTLFLVTTPIIGVVGTVLLYIFSNVHWQTWMLFTAMFILSGLSITAGYHRLFAHKSYRAVWPVRLLFVLFGSAAFEGSVIEWSTDHRDHHRFTDTERDPYNIKKGFWYAHLGWLLHLDTTKRHFTNVNDLKRSRMLRFQHQYYAVISMTMGLLLPTLIASFWGAPLEGFVIGGALRIVLTHHSTFCINSLCHLIGNRTYSNSSSAKDNWISALLTFGEGYHNYHHRFPADYRNGIRLYHFDPTKWLIRTLSFFRLAKDLRRIPNHRIIQEVVNTHDSILLDKVKNDLPVFLQQSIMNAVKIVREFELTYNEFLTKEHLSKLKLAKSDLYALFYVWRCCLHFS